MSTHPDDRRLAERMLRDDEAAFEEFFGRYFPALYRFVLARLGDADAAEEVAQATLCKAVAKLATYRGEAALFTWLCTFCRHEIGAFLERTRRSPVALGLAEDAAEIRGVLESLAASGEDDPAQSFGRKELSRFVQAILDALPHSYGDALEWKYIQGLSVAEVAARLGVSVKAAESLLTRAREAFRDGFAALSAAGRAREEGA